jgi:hypothetical protein
MTGFVDHQISDVLEALIKKVRKNDSTNPQEIRTELERLAAPIAQGTEPEFCSKVQETLQLVPETRHKSVTRDDTDLLELLEEVLDLRKKKEKELVISGLTKLANWLRNPRFNLYVNTGILKAALRYPEVAQIAAYALTLANDRGRVQPRNGDNLATLANDIASRLSLT